MINITYILRRKNTYIFIILLTIISIFLSIIVNYKNSLNNNKTEYEYYFLVKESEINDINIEDILLESDCLLIDNYYIVDQSEELTNNEMILSYKLNENNLFVSNGNWNILKYDKNTYISNDKMKEYDNELKYKKVYLKLLTDYEKYSELIEKSDYSSIPVDIGESKKLIFFFNRLLIVLYIMLFILLGVVVANMIYDNKKNFKLLNLFGYKKKDMILITGGQLIIVLVIPILILLFV